MTHTPGSPPASEGGPAPRLAVAPDEYRCAAMTAAIGGASLRCSRFTLRKADGRRDDFCIAHSRTRQAELLRTKATKAQRDAQRAESERRQKLARKMLPRVWASRREFQVARFRVHRALVEHGVTPQEASVLRALIKDAEEHVQTLERDWPSYFPIQPNVMPT